MTGSLKNHCAIMFASAKRNLASVVSKSDSLRHLCPFKLRGGNVLGIAAATFLGIASLHGAPGAAKPDAAKAALAAKRAAQESAAKAHFDTLSRDLPTLKMSDVKGHSLADLQALYYDAFRKQGLSIYDAKKKASDIRQ